MFEYKIERMQKEHLASVAQLEKECFPLPWTEEQISSEIFNPIAYYVVLLKENEVIGYGGYLNLAEEANIMDIAVKVDYQGQGLGKIIVKHLIENAKANNLTAMTLECRESNIKAQKLYESLDFVFVGKRPKYYENVEDAYIYWLYF